MAQSAYSSQHEKDVLNQWIGVGLYIFWIVCAIGLALLSAHGGHR